MLIFLQGFRDMAAKLHVFKTAYMSQSQLSIDGFDTPFGKDLDLNNRWVRLSENIPWDQLVSIYHQKTKAGGRPPINGRVIIGAMIIKHFCDFSDRETIEHIRENIYNQAKNLQKDPPAPCKADCTGKGQAATEFGANINISMLNGYTFLDELSWNAFNEGSHLVAYLKSFKERMGHYPKQVLVDGIYCNRENRLFCKENHIKLSGKPLGRPPKDPSKRLKLRQETEIL
jgi:hypothetical protein